MQDANLYKHVWTALKLQMETCLIQYNLMDYINKGTIMGVLHNRWKVTDVMIE